MKELPSIPDDIPDQPHGESILCRECMMGLMRPRRLTYFTWLNQELVTVANFPARVCDVCGRREYDPRAVNWLNSLLDPHEGHRKNRYRKPKPPRPEQPHP